MRRGPTFLITMAATLIATSGLTMTAARPAHAFATYNDPFGNKGHAEHEHVTRAALACPPGKASDGNCFEPKSLTGLAGTTGYLGGVGRADNWRPWSGELSDEKAHCDNADYIRKDDNGGTDYVRTRDQASDTLIGCLSHLRMRFRQGADSGNQTVRADNSIPYYDSNDPDQCWDGLPPGGGSAAKCRFLDYFGRAVHGVQDFYSHSNWVDQAEPGQPTSVTNPPGMGKRELSPLFALRTPVPGRADIPEQLSTGCYPSDECAGRIRHDEELNKDRAIIDAAGNVTFDRSWITHRGGIADNEQQAVTWAINDTRRQWQDMKAELLARYGNDRGNRIICVLTHDEPTGAWPWTHGACDS